MKKQLSLFALAGFGLVNAMVSYAALPQLQPADGEIGGHEYVDLGLPSGLLWATCNLGAETPFEIGDMYAWGETVPKTVFDYDNYQHLVEIVVDENNYVDFIMADLGECIAGTQYDAAAVNWGYGWRMPTMAEIDELIEATGADSLHPQQWMAEGDVSGMSVGDRLFFTAGADVDYHTQEHPGGVMVKFGRYASASMVEFDDYTGNGFAYSMQFIPEQKLDWRTALKYFGRQIRPVYGEITNRHYSISYGGGQSGIAEAVAEGAKVGVRVVGGSLVVTGAPEGASVAVYDLAGRRVMASALNGHTVDLPSLTPGVYIATVAGKSVKVRL